MTKKTTPVHHEAAPEPVPLSERGATTHNAYDNEADEGCVCVLTFEDGSTATGSSPRTEDLAADQLAAYKSAIDSIGA